MRTLLAAGVVALLAGCGTVARQHTFPVGAGEDNRYASETLADWARYAHHLVVFEVLSERPRGRRTRWVTVRVERDALSRPGAPRLPHRFEMATTEGDWWGIPPLEVGERYVAPLRRIRGGWSPLGLATQLKLDGNDVVGFDETVDELAMDVARAGR